MAATRPARDFPWVPALAGAALAVGGMAFLVRTPQPVQADVRPAATALEMVSLEDGVEGESRAEDPSLLDPVPLYLPTPLNSGQAAALADTTRPELGVSFRNFQARMVFREMEPQLAFPSPVPVPSSPVEAFKGDRGRGAFGYLGRTGEGLNHWAPRLGYLQVSRADTGAIVLEMELPAVQSAPASDWAPVQLVAAVKADGLAGLPFVTSGSGSSGFDAWVPGYLANSFRLGDRLRPGIYRISLGP